MLVLSMVLLTKKLILSRARAHDLNSVKNLNCWGSELTDVSILKDIPNVEVINASVNDIEQLEAFSCCHNLKELYLRRNKIKSVEELLHLADLRNLRCLWLSGNPFCDSLSNEEYRQSVIKILPQIQKLDNSVVTSSELQRALQSTLESRDVDFCDFEVENAVELNLNDSSLKSDNPSAPNASLEGPKVTKSVSSIPENLISKNLDMSGTSKSTDSSPKETKSPNVSIPRSKSPDLPKLSRSLNTSTDTAEVAISISIDDSETSTSTSTTFRPLPVPGKSGGDSASTSASKPSSEVKNVEGASLFVEDSLEETNKLRLELGLQPITPQKYHLSVSQPFKPPKKHKKHTPKNNILRASLALIEELDVTSLFQLQDAIQEKLEEFELDTTPEATRELLAS